ncbi:type IV CRISPR-associated DEAD/DEAH-box helicase Csf4 [Burkholderia vietnamiensis]|nr:type IV CRISPR-associated DEAD/DEAH-box helicase Csf4 [Burkholderia vietnamiensis]MBR8189106.1 hypothetical protein [Burkholderia vietnamiensis]
MTLAVPETWLSALIPGYALIAHQDDRVRAAIKSVLVRALETGATIGDSRAVGTGADKRRLLVSLPDPHAGMLRARSAQAGAGPGPTATALLGAMLNVEHVAPQWDESDPIVRLTRILQMSDTHVVVRGEQVQVGGMLRDSLRRGLIGVIEAGTGVGKTRAMVASALEWIAVRQKTACIAVPTIALARQFAAEYATQARALAVASCDIADLRIVFGRREFVSEHALMRFVDDATTGEHGRADVEAIRAWVRNGAAAPDPTAGVDASWLISSLEYVAPAFPVDEVRLSDLSLASDRGFQSYRAQFDRYDKQADLLICTHAMLAQDMRFRLREAYKDSAFRGINREMIAALASMKDLDDPDAKADLRSALPAIQHARGRRFVEVTEDCGVLPDYWSLIVDEAHLLEQNFANALSDYVSLKATVRHAWDYRDAGGKISAQSIQSVADLVEEVTSLGSAVDREFFNMSGGNEIVHRFGVLFQRIGMLLDDVAMPRKREDMKVARAMSAYQLIHARAALRNAIGAAAGHSYLRFSPIRAYPQLYIGNGSVESTLRTMWSRVDAGAVVSATLYLTRADNRPDAQYQRMLLGLPDKRWVEYPPVHAPWNVTPVKGLWTAGQMAAALRPPTRADRLTATEHLKAEDAWMDRLAPVIQSIHDSAAGGVLVLMTSYRTVSGVAKRLAHMEHVLVEAVAGQPLRRQVDKFLGMRRDGRRPLWLAVGSAWTGVDVGGHDPWSRLFDGEKVPAGDDNVLTDLVIPRLPYGTNQSITHLWRMQNRPNVPWEILEAAFRFKQGMGRLVRRQGLPQNRRIFVLDGRLGDPMAASSYALFFQLFTDYPRCDLTSNPIDEQ